MKHLKSMVVAILLVVTSILNVVPAFLAPTVSAASTSDNSASLSIEPKKNYVIEPGKSVNDKITISNLDNASDLQLSMRIIDFTYTNDTGTPKLFLAQDAPQTTWSLKPYMTIPETVTIPAGGSKTLPISVKMPSNIGAGSYYSAIIYSTGAPSGGNVGLAASGVTLVFTTVPGKVNENLTLQKFGAYNPATAADKASYVSIATKPPLNIAYTLKNSGNVTESPVGSITLKYMFGGKQIINNVNPTGSLALIGQTRTFTSCIKAQAQNVNLVGSSSQATTCVTPDLWPGLYTASLDIFYGQNGNVTQEITSNTTFWYIPWWFVILVVVVLIVLAFVIWRAYSKLNGKFGGGRSKKSTHRK